MVYATPTNITGFIEMFRYTNEVSGNIFGTGILLSLFLISFMYLKMNGERLQPSIMASGFLTSFVAIILFLMGIVEGYAMFLCFIITVIGAIWQYYAVST